MCLMLKTFKLISFGYLLNRRNSINPDSNFATLQVLLSSKNQSANISRNMEEEFYRIS